MENHIVVTLVGPDKVGIVDDVTEKILEYGGNVEESRMARLGGDFAMIMLISVTGDKTDKLKTAIDTFGANGFQVFIRETAEETKSKYKGWLPYRIVVNGADHEGIIHSITRHLADKNINIESMDTNTVSAPMSGTELFTMSAVVIAPPDIKYHTWRDHLNEIEDEMNVTVDVTPYRG